MNCEAARSMIEPYIDGELDAAQKAEIERHLSECADCRAAHRQLSQLGEGLRAPGLRYEAPDRLKARVLDGVRQAAVTPLVPMPVPISRGPSFQYWAIAATMLLAVSVGWNLMLLRSQKNAGDAVVQEIIASHVRSLIGEHLLDVQSTDQHNVKPWFNGKIDYAPDVKDFAAEGFPLIGGRVDYLDHRPVAALVYKRHQHSINLFVWPSGASVTAPEAESGYSLVTWRKAGMNYCAVSDLNGAELRQFGDLYH